MDHLDRKLITLLRHDSRRGLAGIAAELKVSRATVRARLGRLEKDGEILGYTVVLKGDAFSAPVRAMTLIEVEGRKADDVIRELKGFASVGAVHTTAGKWDIIIDLFAQSLADLDAILRQLRYIAGVTASETHLLLATPRSTRARL